MYDTTPAREPEEAGISTSGEATEPAPRMVPGRVHAGHPEVQHAQHLRLTALLPRGGLEERPGHILPRGELPLTFGDEHQALAEQARAELGKSALRNALACWGKFVLHQADEGKRRTRSAWHRWAGRENERMEQLELPQARAPDPPRPPPKLALEHFCLRHGRNRCRCAPVRAREGTPELARCGRTEQREAKGA